ncbi:MAG: 2-oxoglutarate dehydrogenase E1 subunit family protein, partial [Ferruginibacter sp.]
IMKDFQYITNATPAYIENLYRNYQQDPTAVDPELKKFFEGFDFAVTAGVVNTETTTGDQHPASSMRSLPYTI